MRLYKSISFAGWLSVWCVLRIYIYYGYISHLFVFLARLGAWNVYELCMFYSSQLSFRIKSKEGDICVKPKTKTKVKNILFQVYQPFKVLKIAQRYFILSILSHFSQLLIQQIKVNDDLFKPMDLINYKRQRNRYRLVLLFRIIYQLICVALTQNKIKGLSSQF